MTLKDALGRTLLPPSVGSVDSPEVGDFWVLSTDGEDRACMLVAGVRGNLVSAWPVTASGAHVSFPAFQLTTSGLGPVDVWPQAQFSVCFAALSRRVARNLDATIVGRIGRAVTERDNDLPIPAHPPITTDAQWDDLDAVCLSGWSIGAWEWPSRIAGGVFDCTQLAEAGIEVRDLARMLGVSPKQASSLFAGEVTPTEAQVAALRTTTDSADWGLLREPSGPEVDELVHPRFKSRIDEVRGHLGITESVARTMVWESAITTAARQSTHEDRTVAARERVRDAIDRLLAEPREG